MERETKESTSHWSSFRVKQLEDNQAFHIVKSDCLLPCPLCVMLLKNLALIFPLHHKMSLWLSQPDTFKAQERCRRKNPPEQLHSWDITMGFISTSSDFNSVPLPSFIPFSHSVISQNFLCQVLSKVLRVQRQ